MCFDTILVKQGAQNPVGIRKYPAKLASAGYRVVEREAKGRLAQIPVEAAAPIQRGHAWPKAP